MQLSTTSALVMYGAGALLLVSRSWRWLTETWGQDDDPSRPSVWEIAIPLAIMGLPHISAVGVFIVILFFVLSPQYAVGLIALLTVPLIVKYVDDMTDLFDFAVPRYGRLFHVFVIGCVVVAVGTVSLPSLALTALVPALNISGSSVLLLAVVTWRVEMYIRAYEPPEDPPGQSLDLMDVLRHNRKR